MSELDIVNSNLDWLRKNMEKNEKLLEEIFDRLRKIETDLAALEAKQRPPISGWAIFGVVGSIAATILIVLDRIYVNQ